MRHSALHLISLIALCGCGPTRTSPAAIQPSATTSENGPRNSAANSKTSREPPREAVAKKTVGAIEGVVSAAQAEKVDEADKREVKFTFEVRVPMRDGKTLAARLYQPTGGAGRVPALLVKTPYNASNYHQYGMYFARRGYAVALVDARGRGNSQGDFRAFEDDGRDGHDVVEWLAAQPWCDGKVGMFGGSYDGFGQWATYKHRPPHLATIVPVASVGPGVDFPIWNSISYPYVIRWLTYVTSKTLNGPIFGDDTLWAPSSKDVATGKVTFRGLDERVGNPSPTFQSWQKHPTLDAFWRSKMPMAAEWRASQIPVLTITGHYDDDQPGAMHYYLSHMRDGNRTAKKRHYLVMGPWDHSGTRRPNAELGGLRVGANSVIDMKDLHRQWYDWILKGKKRPAFLSKRVTYYMTGASQWRRADTLAGATSEKLVLHLDSEGRANDVQHSGRLTSQAPTRALADSYTVNPLDPRLVVDDSVVGLDAPLVNRMEASPPPGASLVYHSAVFDNALELAGNAVLEMAVEMDVPDTDFWAGLFELRADGQTILLTSTVLRARDQGGLKKPGQVFNYRLDDFAYFAHRMAAGSRLRLALTPPLGSSWQRNFQSGGVVADQLAKDARTGTIKLLHGGKHRSSLTLGVVRSQPK